MGSGAIFVTLVAATLPEPEMLAAPLRSRRRRGVVFSGERGGWPVLGGPISAVAGAEFTCPRVGPSPTSTKRGCSSSELLQVEGKMRTSEEG